MSFIINPQKYDINEESRLIVATVLGNEIYKKIVIPAGQKLILSDNKIESDLDKYKFRLQERKENSWLNKTKYFKLIDSKDLSKYLTDKITLDEDNVMNLINYYTNSKSESNNINFRKSYKIVCESLWLAQNAKHVNLEKFLNFVENKNISLNDLWQNLILYLKYTLRLKKKFQSMGANHLYYDDLIIRGFLAKESEIYNFLSEEISELKKIDLQFSFLLQGLYYSLIGERNEASKSFDTVSEYSTGYENEFLVGQGSQTYNILDIDKNNYPQNIKYLSKKNNNRGKTTILVSVDTKYLRNYSPQILYSIIALKKFHIHFHIIGKSEEAIKAVVETEMLFNNLVAFMGKTSPIIPPTFSYEEVPEFVYSYKTLSACSRFINASYFMDEFNSNLLILDADMFITDDLSDYISSMQRFDVAVAMSKGITTIMPWRRVMAGNLYLVNNDLARSFIDLAGSYIIDNLDKEKSWTLDQNALSFAYEEVMKKHPNIKIENIYKYKKPISHPQLRTFIERD